MSSSLRYPRSGVALHGLAILALAAILMDCLFSAQEAIETISVEPADPSPTCVYQVALDDRCLGTISTCVPEALSTIVETMGLAHELTSAVNAETIPCDRIIKFRQDSSGYSLQKIPGAHLVCLGRPIDINLADERDLTAIPGIGPRTAEKIVRYREDIGGFSKVEELQNIPGIGRKKFVAMAPFVQVKASGSLDKLQYVQAP